MPTPSSSKRIPDAPCAVLLGDLVDECDRLLQPGRFQDWENAHNGLQVSKEHPVHKLAAAVDASESTIRKAIAGRADLLVVHHGLFWGPRHPWIGRHFRLLRQLLEHDVAVYSAHLPLDAHRRLGNNAQLCQALGWRSRSPFLECRGQKIGWQTRRRVPRDELVQQVSRVVQGPVHLIPGGPTLCRRIGVVSGGAGDDLAQAAAEGVDTYITGEGPHWTCALAEELGLNVLYAGHYATEVFGVKALAAHLARKFGLPWMFIDNPTGL